MPVVFPSLNSSRPLIRQGGRGGSLKSDNRDVPLGKLDG